MAENFRDLNIQLELLYDHFNDKYFNGRLPIYSVRVITEEEMRKTTPDKWYCYGRCDRLDKTIWITYEEYTGKGIHWREVLIHEMCHVATNGKHEKAFLNKLSNIIHQYENNMNMIWHLQDYQDKFEQRQNSLTKKEWNVAKKFNLLGKKFSGLNTLAHMVTKENDISPKEFLRVCPVLRRIEEKSIREHERKKRRHQEFLKFKEENKELCDRIESAIKEIDEKIQSHRI